MAPGLGVLASPFFERQRLEAFAPRPETERGVGICDLQKPEAEDSRDRQKSEPGGYR